MSKAMGRDRRCEDRYGGARALMATALAVASCALAACSVLSSDAVDRLDGATEERAGVYYALPMGLIDVTLLAKQETADFQLAFSKVKYIADPSQRYLVHYNPLPNYSDDIKIEVSSRALLSSVWATTEDKTDEIIVEVAKIFRGFGAFQVGKDLLDLRSSGYKTLSTITIDPSDPARLRGAAEFLTRRAKAFVDRAVAACAATKTGACERFARLSLRTSRLVEFSVVPPEPIAEAPVPDCTSGICYRVKEPYVLEYTVDGLRRAKIVYLPNKAPLVEIDITRALFVSKIQKLEFDTNGFLKSAYVEKGSELEAVSALPINVITAISQTMPFRLTVQQKQVDLAEARAAGIDAKRKLAEAKKSEGNSPDKE